MGAMGVDGGKMWRISEGRGALRRMAVDGGM